MNTRGKRASNAEDSPLKRKKLEDPDAPHEVEFPAQLVGAALAIPGLHPARQAGYNLAYNLGKHLAEVAAGDYEPVSLIPVPTHLDHTSGPGMWEPFGGEPIHFLPGAPLKFETNVYLIVDGVQRALACYLLNETLKARIYYPHAPEKHCRRLLEEGRRPVTPLQPDQADAIRRHLWPLLRDASRVHLKRMECFRLLSPDQFAYATPWSSLNVRWEMMGIRPAEALVDPGSLLQVLDEIGRALGRRPSIARFARPVATPTAPLDGLLSEIIHGIAQLTSCLGGPWELPDGTFHHPLIEGETLTRIAKDTVRVLVILDRAFPDIDPGLHAFPTVQDIAFNIAQARILGDLIPEIEDMVLKGDLPIEGISEFRNQVPAGQRKILLGLQEDLATIDRSTMPTQEARRALTEAALRVGWRLLKSPGFPRHRDSSHRIGRFHHRMAGCHGTNIPSLDRQELLDETSRSVSTPLDRPFTSKFALAAISHMIIEALGRHPRLQQLVELPENDHSGGGAVSPRFNLARDHFMIVKNHFLREIAHGMAQAWASRSDPGSREPISSAIAKETALKVMDLLVRLQEVHTRSPHRLLNLFGIRRTSKIVTQVALG